MDNHDHDDGVLEFQWDDKARYSDYEITFCESIIEHIRLFSNLKCIASASVSMFDESNWVYGVEDPHSALICFIHRSDDVPDLSVLVCSYPPLVNAFLEYADADRTRLNIQSVTINDAPNPELVLVNIYESIEDWINGAYTFEIKNVSHRRKRVNYFHHNNLVATKNCPPTYTLFHMIKNIVLKHRLP